MDANEKELRIELLKVGETAFKEGLVYGSSGNISARIPGTRKCLIKPSGFELGNLSPEDFCIVDIDTLAMLSGNNKPSVETPFHTIMYRLRDDAGGVVHTHSHYATILATCNVQLKPIGMAWLRTPGLAKGVMVSEFAPPGTDDLAKNIAEGIGDGVAVLMPHHGVTAIGKTVREALNTAKDVEALAQFTYECMLLGHPQALPQSLLDTLRQIRED